MVAILDNQYQEPQRAQSCAVPVIAERWVLTAAHCVTAENGNATITLVIGTAIFSTGGKRVHLHRIVAHPQWDRMSDANDTALLHTAVSLWIANVQMVDLADTTMPLGADMVIAGWGIRFRDDPGSSFV